MNRKKWKGRKGKKEMTKQHSIKYVKELEKNDLEKE